VVSLRVSRPIRLTTKYFKSTLASNSGVSSVGFSLRTFLSFWGTIMPRRKIFFTPLAILIVATLATLTSTATTVPVWDAKDWTQWTAEDCDLILTKSPWVSTASWNGPNAYEKGGQSQSVAQIVSSLIIRQASVRQAQIQVDHDHMDAAAKKEFDQSAAACLAQNVDDRIVIGMDANAQSDESKLAGNVEISKRTIPLTQVTDWIASNPCPFYAVVVSIPRTLDGKPSITAADKKFEIKGQTLRHFSFDVQKMMYKGKLDF